MRASAFDELLFFRAISECGARALLIGRRALVLLGLPVLTADYDFWLHPEDVGRFNAACARFDLVPTRSPEDARRPGRYTLENDEHVDVLVARSVSTTDGTAVSFDRPPGLRTLAAARTGRRPGRGDVIRTGPGETLVPSLFARSFQSTQ